VLPHHNFVQVSHYEQHMHEITKYKVVVVSNAIILKQNTEKICHLTQKCKYQIHTNIHTHTI